MRIHDLKLRNLAHTLSLSVFIAFKGTNFYILLTLFGRVYKAHMYIIKPYSHGMFLHIWQKAYMEKAHMLFYSHDMQRTHMF